MIRIALLLVLAFDIYGCGGATTGGKTAAAVAGPSAQTLAISGTPSGSAFVGSAYLFAPSVQVPAGQTPTFSVTNLPTWAHFNSATGAISGTPSAADVGTDSNIAITASDGVSSTQIAPFTIAVTAYGTGAATLSWLPPTQNTDGSLLTNLAGYRIYYGMDASNLTQVAQVGTPGLASYVIDNLGPGTWYFSVKAYTAANIESSPSATATKTIG